MATADRRAPTHTSSTDDDTLEQHLLAAYRVVANLTGLPSGGRLQSAPEARLRASSRTTPRCVLALPHRVQRDNVPATFRGRSNCRLHF